MHQVRFRPARCVSLQCSPRPIAGLRGPYSKWRGEEEGKEEGREGKGEKRNGKGKEGKEGKEVETFSPSIPAYTPLVDSLHISSLSLPSARQHPSYGDCLEVKREYYQNCSVLDCVT